MYFGKLKASAEYFRVGTKISAEFSVDENGKKRFEWKKLYGTGIDLNLKLGIECFVGSVTLPFSASSLHKGATVFCDGKPVGSYLPETGGELKGEITVEVGVYASGLTVRIFTALADLVLDEPITIGCCDEGSPLLYPTPTRFTREGGKLRLGKLLTENGSEDESYAARFLSSELDERGIPIRDEGVPVRFSIEGFDPENEEYTVLSSEEGVKITASNRRMLLFAVTRLLALEQDGSFPCFTLKDRPDKSLRGFHMGLPSRENIAFTKRLFKYVLLPLGYNTVFVEFCGGMRFDSHPEISEAWLEGNRRAKAGLQPTFPHDYMGAEGGLLEKNEVRELLDYAHELGLKVIPEVQSLGHVQYITYAHPELAEKEEEDREVEDTRAEDERPHNFYSHCYCPSNEDSYKLIFDLIDEIVEVAKPDGYVHIGHDEVYHLGLCKRCRGKSHAELYAGHVLRLYNYLKEKGLGTVMWSDMIQPVTKYQTPAAIDMLPKDILMLDFIWYFHLDKDIEENLLSKGYTVGIGNLYSSHYPRYEKRIRSKGIVGGEVSTWCPTNEYRLGKKGKIFDLTYTAEMLWRADGYVGAMKRTLYHVIAKKLQPLQRNAVRGIKPCNNVRQDFGAPKGEAVRDADITFKRPLCVMADGAKVSLYGKWQRLYIEHATLNPIPRIPWQELIRVGEYTVTYSDGTAETIFSEYGGNIQAIGRVYGAPLPEQLHRHTGYIGTWFSDPVLEDKNSRGEDMLSTAYVWENPHPEKELAELSFRSAVGDVSLPILFGAWGEGIIQS